MRGRDRCKTGLWRHLIGITGAVVGDVLTCAVLEQDRVGFLTSEKAE